MPTITTHLWRHESRSPSHLVNRCRQQLALPHPIPTIWKGVLRQKIQPRPMKWTLIKLWSASYSLAPRGQIQGCYIILTRPCPTVDTAVGLGADPDGIRPQAGASTSIPAEKRITTYRPRSSEKLIPSLIFPPTTERSRAPVTVPPTWPQLCRRNPTQSC